MKYKYYDIRYAKKAPEMRGLGDGEVWRQVQPLSVDCFRPEGSNHRPQTQCRLLYDERNIYGLFRVKDQYVRCIHTSFQENVWKDSCVEFFVQPEKSAGYFNFEFNCGGAMLASYVTDPKRYNGRLNEYISLTPDDDEQIQRYVNLPTLVEPEILKPVVWTLEFSIPLVVLKKYVGQMGPLTGQKWRANFYKCGNETSHPHWASWAPLSACNFHEPASFGYMKFCG